MVSVETRDEVVQKMWEDAENRRCFDCAGPDPQWALVPFGVFICDMCAGHHRTLGIDPSLLRSTKFDIWNVSQLKRMSAGGNAALMMFFSDYGILGNAAVEYKYRTVAALYYMELLAALAEGLELTIPQPVPEEGVQISAKLDPSFAATTVPPPKPGPLGMVKGFLKKAVKVSQKTGSQILTKLNTSPTLLKVEEKTVAAFESLGDQLNKGKTKITESATYQSVKTTTSGAVKSLANSAKGAYQKLVHRNPRPEEEPVPEAQNLELEEKAKMQE